MNINKIIINLLLREPFYGYILCSLKLQKSNSIEDLKLIIGPTVQLIYNNEWLDSLDEKQAHGMILHELLHLIFMHPLRRAGREAKVWAMAGDLAVNEHIHKDMLPQNAFTLEKANRLLGLKMEPYQSADYYYEILNNQELASSLPFSFNDDKMQISFPDEEEISIKLEEEGDLPELNKKAVESQLDELIRQANLEGEIPGKVLNIVGGIYGSVKVNWRNVLKQFVTGKGRMQSYKTVKRISKRFEDMPGNKRQKGLEALVAIDESASINDEDVLRFYKELRMIKRSIKANLMVTRFDTDCTKPVPLENYLKTKDRAKQGGTDFRPIFQLADKMNMRMVIVFTDGEGLLPTQIKQQALWVLTKDTKVDSSLGNSVMYSAS